MARSTQQTRFRLANQILDVIRDARMEPGHHLREQPLADLIGVSRTPIRSALDLLAERGIVETRKNQGFFLRKAFDTLHRIDPATVKAEVTAAGFKFVGESNVLRNPKDPRTALVFDKSIRGHTDQFIYKFKK